MSSSALRKRRAVRQCQALQICRDTLVKSGKYLARPAFHYIGNASDSKRTDDFCPPHRTEQLLYQNLFLCIQGIFVLLHIRIMQQWNFRRSKRYPSRLLMHPFAPPGLIREQCEGILTGNIIARFAPLDFASSMPRSTAFL